MKPELRKAIDHLKRERLYGCAARALRDWLDKAPENKEHENLLLKAALEDKIYRKILELECSHLLGRLTEEDLERLLAIDLR
jgi:hypothetical protein